MLGVTFGATDFFENGCALAVVGAALTARGVSDGAGRSTLRLAEMVRLLKAVAVADFVVLVVTAPAGRFVGVGRTGATGLVEDLVAGAIKGSAG